MESTGVETFHRELDAACAFLKLVEHRLGEPLPRVAYSVMHFGWKPEVAFFLLREFPLRDRICAVVEQLVAREGEILNSHRCYNLWSYGEITVIIHYQEMDKEGG